MTDGMSFYLIFLEGKPPKIKAVRIMVTQNEVYILLCMCLQRNVVKLPCLGHQSL